MNPYLEQDYAPSGTNGQVIKQAAIGTGAVILSGLSGAVVGYMYPKAGVILVLAGIIPPQYLTRSGHLDEKAWGDIALDSMTAFGVGTLSGAMVSTLFTQTGMEKPSVIEVARKLTGTVKSMWPFNLMGGKSDPNGVELSEGDQPTGQTGALNAHEAETNELLLAIAANTAVPA